MTENTTTPEPRPCLAVGALTIDGTRRAWLRCALPAGHDLGATPHAVTFSWADDEAMREDWPEAYDPAEPLDVEVPELTPEEVAEIAESRRVDELVDGEREARALPDDE